MDNFVEDFTYLFVPTNKSFGHAVSEENKVLANQKQELLTTVMFYYFFAGFRQKEEFLHRTSHT